MPHTRFPQWARTLTAEKGDCSLFSRRWKNQPPFLTPRKAVGGGPARSLADALAQSPPPSSLAASAEGVEGAETLSTDSVQILQDFKPAGLRIGLGTPQELVASRVTVRHQLIHQVPLLHPHLGQQLPGLPIDEVFLTGHNPIPLSAAQLSSSGTRHPPQQSGTGSPPGG